MKFGPKKAIMAGLVAAGLALAGCSGTPAENAAGGQTSLTLGTLNDVRSWDPAQAHVGHQLQPYQAVYDSLLLREPDGTLSPMLATEWTYNEDQSVLTLKLKDGVTFSDGAVFDAEAVKANLEHFQSGNGPQMSMLAALSGIKVIDASSIELTLSKPDPAFTYYLSQAAGLMGSPKALTTDGIKTVPVGSGPYVMDKASSVKDSVNVFNARDGYWNKDLQKFDKVTFKVLTDVTARTNALVSGQVDATILDPKNGKQAEGANMKPAINQVDWQGLLLMDRDGVKNPALGNLKFRQALNYAFDRETILEQIMLGQGTATSQPFGEESGAWVDSLESKYTYDPAKAKALLKEAGFETGASISVPSFPGFEPMLAVLKQQLADVGVTLEVLPAATNTFTSDVAAQKYTSMFFSLFQGEPWVAINQMISTSALYNPFKSTTPELQTMIDAVQTGGDNSSELAKKVNEYVVDQAWFVPLFRVNQMYFHNDKITVTPQIQMAVPSIYNYSPVK